MMTFIMEPRIQYTKSGDGTNIAYWSMGSGPPLVHLPISVLNHADAELQPPEYIHWRDRLAERHMVVQYSMRGTGLSEREVDDLTVEAHVSDLSAVVDRLELDHFVLLAGLYSGPTGITYAARNPDRVSHLILICAYARGADSPASPQAEALLPLLEVDWETYSETWANLVLGWSAGDPARRAAALLRESVSPDMLKRSMVSFAEADAFDLLPQVTSPCLVIQRRNLRQFGMDVARTLASTIPNAQLSVVEGATAAPWREDTDSVLKAIEAFVEDADAPDATQTPSEPGAFRTILFTDVEGSTALTQRLGDQKARDLLREHERVTRQALKEHAGSEVKTMGDGFMTSFTSATKALECAIAMQRAFAERNESAAEPIRIRIGLNAGEPIAEEEDLFGTAVILAARIAAKASAGEILASEGVRQIVAGKQFLFSDRGETEMRGFEDLVRIYEVSWQSTES
jgi:class 3 adenylate cyclase